MIEACAVLLEPRTLLEVAAEIDPDLYVPILDLLDQLGDELECEEAEPEPLEEWLTSHPVPVFERCPCCGDLKHHDEWII